MPPHYAPVQVSKLDAAQRQLRTAIRLWFQDGDPVAIHTLVCAAHEIIHALYRRKGLHDLLFDSDLIKDEFRGEWAKKFKASATFFKHAQRDPDAVLNFNPGINEPLMYFATAGLARMGEPQGIEEKVFVGWLGIHKPDLFKSCPPPIEQLPPELGKWVMGLSKKEFCDGFEAVLRQQR